MAKKKFDPKAKAKRQKVILAVGGVLLLGLLAFQVPRTMKLMKSQSQPTPSTPSSTVAAGSTPLAPPTLDGSSSAGTPSAGGPAAGSAATTADGLSDPSNPLPPVAGQLVSFSMFKSKDPFKQQISAGCGTDSVTGAPTACASTSRPPSTKKASASPSVQPAAKRATVFSAKPTTATISVNGIVSSVSTGGSFPSGSPVFQLVSLTKSSAKIGIVGGSYETGAATVALPKGKNVTLMNTADGTRYTLRLVATA